MTDRIMSLLFVYRRDFSQGKEEIGKVSLKD